MTKEEILVKHLKMSVGSTIDNEIFYGAMQEYADQKAKPLVDCIESMKKQYGNSEWIVRACDEALANYNNNIK